MKSNINAEYISKAIEHNFIKKINKKKYNNIAKHMRIANATTGAERQKHLALARKKLDKYAPPEVEYSEEESELSTD